MKSFRVVSLFPFNLIRSFQWLLLHSVECTHALNSNNLKLSIPVHLVLKHLIYCTSFSLSQFTWFRLLAVHVPVVCVPVKQGIFCSYIVTISGDQTSYGIGLASWSPLDLLMKVQYSYRAFSNLGVSFSCHSVLSKYFSHVHASSWQQQRTGVSLSYSGLNFGVSFLR